MLIEHTIPPGTRSSTDDTRPDSAGGAEDETTIVEPEQGNGQEKSRHYTAAPRILTTPNSPLPHHITASTWSRSLSRYTPYIYPRAEIYAGKDHKVRVADLSQDHKLILRPQFHGASRNPSSHAENRRSCAAFCFRGQILPQRMAYQTSVRSQCDVSCISAKYSPRGVKKPLNPILGETFTGYWDYSDGTRGYYIAEQTSHHPPKSSYFFMAPEHGIRVDGTLKPRSKFLGNSAASMMEGISYLTFMNRGKSRGGEK